ncbi:MAG: hypothetical protein ACRDNS_28560, partial [Trebonia sp.]
GADAAHPRPAHTQGDPMTWTAIKTDLGNVINVLALLVSGWAVIAQILGGVGVPAKILSTILAGATVLLATLRDLYGLKVQKDIAVAKAQSKGA